MASEGPSDIKIEPGLEQASSESATTQSVHVTQALVDNDRSSVVESGGLMSVDTTTQQPGFIMTASADASSTPGAVGESEFIRTITMSGEGLSSVRASPNFTPLLSNTDPMQIGALKIVLPSGQKALVKVQDPSVQGTTTGVVTMDNRTVSNEPAQVTSQQIDNAPEGMEAMIPSSIDGSAQGSAERNLATEDSPVTEVPGGGGDHATEIRVVATGRESSAVQRVRPTGAVEPAFSEFRIRSEDDPNEVYASALLEARRAAREENAALYEQRRDQLTNLSEQYNQELKRKAAEYAAFCVQTDANLESNKHASQVRHMREKLDNLRKVDVAALAGDGYDPTVPQMPRATIGRRNVVLEPRQFVTMVRPPQPASRTFTEAEVQAQIRAATSRRLSAGPVGNYETLSAGSTHALSSTAPRISTSSLPAPETQPERIDDGRQSPRSSSRPSTEDFYAASRRRSPRAHASSRAFDVTAPEQRSLSLPPPITSRRSDSNIMASVIADIQGQYMQMTPISASEPAEPGRQNFPDRHERKRRSTERIETEVSGLDQLFEPKRGRTTSTSEGSRNVTSSQQSLVYGSSEYMKQQAEMKIQKAKELDVILQETKKLSNKPKIKEHLDNCGLDVKPNPLPVPLDTFCYNCSLAIEGIQQDDSNDRATEVRKELINYIATNLSGFTETWMKPICDEKGTDVFSWLSTHTSSATHVDGLFVVLMAAFLHRPIRIYSHLTPWMSDEGMGDPLELCFAGGNLFCSTEVVEETFWRQFASSIGQDESGLDIVFTEVKREEDSSNTTKNLPRHQRNRARSNQKQSKIPVRTEDTNIQQPSAIDAKKKSKNNNQSTNVNQEAQFGFEDDANVDDHVVTDEQERRQKSKSKMTGVKAVSIIKTESEKDTKAEVGKAISCSECCEQFVTEEELKEHACKYMKCSFCPGLSLPSEAELLTHVREAHHCCNYEDCDHYFDSANGLKYHITHVHKSQPVYPCLICNRIFRSNVSKTNHESKCKGAKAKKVYNCNYCVAYFKSDKIRNEHEISCQKNPKRVIPCKLCTESFNGLDALKKHLVTFHAQGLFLCQHCHHGFDGAEGLRKHQTEGCENVDDKLTEVKKEGPTGTTRKTRSKGPATGAV